MKKHLLRRQRGPSLSTGKRGGRWKGAKRSQLPFCFAWSRNLKIKSFSKMTEAVKLWFPAQQWYASADSAVKAQKRSCDFILVDHFTR